MRNSYHKKRIFILLFLALIFISSVNLFHPVFSSTSEETNIQWGDNIQQNLPYTYYGTFYETTDYEFAYTNAKIEFTYIPDTSLNDEYTITEDFNNTESQNDTQSYNSTDPFGHYNATYSFEGEVGETGTDIGFVDILYDNFTVRIDDSYKNHSAVMYTSTEVNNEKLYNNFDDRDYGVIELWYCVPVYDTGWKFGLYTTGTSGNVIYVDQDDLYFYNIVVGSVKLKDDIVNEWLHLKIEIDSNANEYNIWVNGEENNFETTGETLKYLLIWHYVSGDIGYLDAIGFSWDATYNLGDNYHDNYYLGYENFESYNETSGEYGNYDATYSFENDDIGSFPDGWSKTDDIGYTYQIISEVEGHSKVLEYSYTSGASAGQNIYQTFAEPQESGTIEVWLCSNATNKAFYMYLYGDSGAGVWWRFEITGSIMAYNGLTNTNIQTYNSDEWYRFQIDFDCITDKFDMYINGILKCEQWDFRNDNSVIYQYKIYDSSGHTDKALYLDALGYSWDSSYTIGDNTNPYGSEVLDALRDNGWALTNYYNNSIGIVGEFNSHKKILNLTDGSTNDRVYAYNYFDTSQTSGTIEYYIKTTDNTNGYLSVALMEGSTFRGYVYIYNGRWYWNDGGMGVVDSGIVASVDTWYRITIEFSSDPNVVYIYINDVLGISDSFDTAPSYIDNLRIMSATSNTKYSIYMDALSYSWEDTNPYFKGSYNRHCNIEAEIDEEIELTFESYQKLMFIYNLTSFYNTSVFSEVSFNFYNYTLEDWYEVNSSVSWEEIEASYNIEAYDLEGLFSSLGNMKFRYYMWNESSTFQLDVNLLNATVTHATQLEYEHTLNLLGTWKYRWKVDIGLGSEYIGSWIYFNVIEQQPNFEGISESRYSTQWILTGETTSSTISTVFLDDFLGDTWTVTEVSEEEMTIAEHEYITGDAKVDEGNPTTNYGSSTELAWDLYNPYQEEWTFLIIATPSAVSDYFDDGYRAVFHFYTYGASGSQSISLATCGSFDESTIIWNNKPSPITGIGGASWGSSDGWKSITASGYADYYRMVPSISNWMYGRSSEYSGTAYDPYVDFYIDKVYHDKTGEGFAYYQTDASELIGIESNSFSDVSLSDGDTFTIDLETDQDNVQLRLYDGGVFQKTIQVLQYNTEYSRQQIEVFVDEDVTFDQVKLVSNLESTEYVKVYNIRAEHWEYTVEEDVENIYLQPYGEEERVLSAGDKNLKIYENDILRVNKTITISAEKHTEIFESVFISTIYVNFYDEDNNYLDFNNFKVYVNYTLAREDFTDKRLSSNEFFVDDGSTVYFKVYDSFEHLVYSDDRIAETFIDITLSVYELKIKNEKLNPISYSLSKEGSTITKTGSLFESEILTMNIATGNYSFEYLEEGESEYKEFNFTLISDYYFRINRSQICFLSYTNQRGEYLNFFQFKTYWNGTLLYENIFYEDIGINASIEIKDHYDISVKNYSFIVSSGNNYVPITLTMYSLKVMNQQENFNHINITRDPNYYESEYSWSEWIAPGEIIRFNLFAGYYKINLTDTEHDTYTYYAYTLSGDDILLITSNNTLAQIIYNIANVNTTIGNQITAVEINLSNQNSEINNTIVSIEINLSNVNSTLGNLLTDINLNILNINSSIDTLFTFTNNSFINLNSNMNNSFIYLENNIIAINQSISTLVIGIDNQISIMNGTVTTMFTEMNNQFIVTQSIMNLSFAFLNQSVVQLANDIEDNHVILYNLIEQKANEMNNSLIEIQTLLNLVNSSVANESLVVQTLINVMGNNMTNYYSTINNLLNLIDKCYRK